MKTVYVEARKKFKEKDINYSLLDKIDELKISVAATIQYIGLLPKVKSYLESKGKEVRVGKGVKYPGQVLGCNSAGFDNSAEAFVLITDGKFHGINNAIQLQKEIYIFNANTLEKIEKEEIEAHNKRTEAKKKAFLTEKKVGLITSSKPGQKNRAIYIVKEKIEKMGKEVYIFEADSINTAELENFPQIKIWVNTACFGLARDDKKIINLADILGFLKS